MRLVLCTGTAVYNMESQSFRNNDQGSTFHSSHTIRIWILSGEGVVLLEHGSSMHWCAFFKIRGQNFLLPSSSVISEVGDYFTYDSNIPRSLRNSGVSVTVVPTAFYKYNYLTRLVSSAIDLAKC